MHDLQEKIVLVTGAAGFIGSHLCDRLLSLGARVIGVDNLSTGKMDNLTEAVKNAAFIFIRADVNHFDEIAPIFGKKKIDYVFHYAALVGVKYVIERPLDVFDDIEGVKHLLSLGRKNGVKKFIFASSSEAYGEPVELPEKEDGPLNPSPKDPYGLTKLVGESLVYYYSQRLGLPGCSLRFFNVYGPRQESSAYGFVVGVFMRLAVSGEPLVIFGDGGQTRNFVYIDDNVEAAIYALLSKKTDGEIINVGSNTATTIKNLAEKIRSISGKKLSVVHEPPRQMEIRHRLPDVSKMNKLLGFMPRISLDGGLRRTYEWYKRFKQNVQ